MQRATHASVVGASAPTCILYLAASLSRRCGRSLMLYRKSNEGTLIEIFTSFCALGRCRYIAREDKNVRGAPLGGQAGWCGTSTYATNSFHRFRCLVLVSQLARRLRTFTNCAPLTVGSSSCGALDTGCDNLTSRGKV